MCNKEDYIKLGLKNMLQKLGDWIYLVQNRDQWLTAIGNTAMNCRVPYRAEDFLTN